MFLWPTHIRRACLCPRLMVDEYKTNSSHKINHSAKAFHGSFFHDKIAKPMFESFATGDDEHLEQLIGDNLDQETLREALWGYMVKAYLVPGISDSMKPGQLTSENTILFSEGLGMLAKFLAETIHRHRAVFETTAALIRELFLMPEQKLKSTYVTGQGVHFEISGKYDALLFDKINEEFIIVEFKCKDDSELVGDLEQVATYAWMIQHTSGIRSSAAVFYLCEEPETKCVGAKELNSLSKASQRLVEEIGRWFFAAQRIAPPVRSDS